MGAWDAYIMCAEAYGWLPDQVDALDPDYIAELTIFWEARTAHNKEKK